MKAKLVVLFISLFVFSNQVLASDYPKSDVEREIDEMGSVLGGEGVVFRPNKVKSTATRVKMGNINKYLYKASIEVLKFAPLASADSKSGVILTEWYSPRDQKNTQFKVTVYIKDDLITPEALEVVAFQRKKKNGKWPEESEPSPIAIVLEDKIIRKARDMYLEEKGEE